MKHPPYLTECSVRVQLHESIQEAIDAAQDNAVICLAEGTWKENVKIDKSLTLRGMGPQQTVIHGIQEGYPVVWILTLEKAQKLSVKVERLTITGAHGECADWYKGICPDGILIQGSAQVKFTDSAVSGNRRNGFSVWNSARAEIINSIVFKNGYYGLWLWDSAQAKISNSTISENGFGKDAGFDSDRDGIILRNLAQTEIINSAISKNCHYGLWLSNSTRARITDSVIFQNRRGGVWLRDTAQAGIVGNRIIKNGGYGVSLYQRPCYITSSAFTGHVSGYANIIPNKDEPDANQKGDVCPEELSFLKQPREGGEYP